MLAGILKNGNADGPLAKAFLEYNVRNAVIGLVIYFLGGEFSTHLAEILVLLAKRKHTVVWLWIIPSDIIINFKDAFKEAFFITLHSRRKGKNVSLSQADWRDLLQIKWFQIDWGNLLELKLLEIPVPLKDI